MAGRYMRAALASLALLLGSGLFADSPTEPPVPFISYNYGVWGHSVPAMPAYEPVASRTGWDLGIGALKNPKDLFADAAGDLYVLDAGNKRVVVLDKDLALLGVVDSFS